MGTKKTSSEEQTEADSTSPIPAVPPPDDPMRRSVELDRDPEFTDREMAEKRLEAIRKTREMPTSDSECLTGGPETTAEKQEPDPT
jgi:hypothetical protein